MKTTLYLFFITISFSFIANENIYREHEVFITEKSFLHIKGATNINTFTCSYNLAPLSQKIKLQLAQLKNTTHFKNAIITLKNTGFDCNSRRINKDFYKLLQTDQHPNIRFELLQTTQQNLTKTEAHIAIKITGVKKLYRIPIRVNKKSSFIEGQFSLDITDFGLVPPKKVLGLITVKKEVDVKFKLEVKITK